RVARDADHDLRVRILDHRLAREPRRGREARRLVEQVVLVVTRRGELLEAALHDDVARRARAVPAAGVLEVDAVREEHVEDRARPAVVLERRLPRIELDHALGLAALEHDTDARHRAERSIAARPVRLAGASRRPRCTEPGCRSITSRTGTSSRSRSTVPRRGTRSTSSTSVSWRTPGSVSATTTTPSSRS